jgi:DNA invertase Pin-like site-specific DNA recombinase
MAVPTIHPSAFPSQSGRTHVAIYARVSTHNAQDRSMQTRELEEHCQRRGWTIAGTGLV